MSSFQVLQAVVDGKAIESRDIHIIYLIKYDGLECMDSKFKTVKADEVQRNDIIYLSTLLDLTSANRGKSTSRESWINLRQFFYFYFMSLYNLCSLTMLPLRPFFKQTAVYRHFRDWILCVKNYSFESGKFWTLVFDMFAGVFVLLLILRIKNPGDLLLSFTQSIVNYLKMLLMSLKGSPIGLKLNVLLNNFFLDCFIYHVQLWWTFLLILAPIIRYLSYPLAILGLFGLSFQLAMLSDLLVIISLHAYCFYVYAAVLYRIEVEGMACLWRVVLGRRKNVLRGRVESHDYMSRQLFLATMFFAALLFLLPTVLVYYIVFATLRFAIYCVTFVLMTLRKKIIVLPVFAFLQWLKGSYACPDCMELIVANSYVYRSTASKITVIVLKLQIQTSTPWRKSFFDTFETINQNEPLSISGFLKGLIQGKMMGFIQPEQNIDMTEQKVI